MSDLKPWAKISSEYLCEENWFKFRRDRLRKGNGEEMFPYYVLEYTNWATIFPVTEDGRVILVRQYRYGAAVWSIEVPGGIMDSHETDPIEAAKRELLEETGYSCGKIERVAILAPNPALQNNVMYCFLATGCRLTHKPQLDENEELEVKLVTIDELKDLLFQNKIIQSLHVSCIFYALEKLKQL